MSILIQQKVQFEQARCQNLQSVCKENIVK